MCLFLYLFLYKSIISIPNSNTWSFGSIVSHLAGDKLRIDLRRKDVPPSKMAILELKFDEAKINGLLLPSALSSAVSNTDELDNVGQTVRLASRLVKRTPAVSARKPQTLDVASSSGGDAGAVTPEIFEALFEAVPQLTIFSQRDMEEHLKTINTIVGDKTQDWDKRVDALKKIRSLLLLQVQNSPSFPSYLKDLSISFLNILQELRSQVIREACITLAYMSKTLKNRLDTFCIYIFQELINLIQSSAKVISSASTIAAQYVIRFTHAPKLVPIMTQNLLQSKSKDIRSSLCELMYFLLEEWSTKSLEKFSVNIKEALKKGIADADNAARKHSRRWVALGSGGILYILIAICFFVCFEFTEISGSFEGTFQSSPTVCTHHSIYRCNGHWNANVMEASVRMALVRWAPVCAAVIPVWIQCPTVPSVSVTNFFHNIHLLIQLTHNFY